MELSSKRWMYFISVLVLAALIFFVFNSLIERIVAVALFLGGKAFEHYMRDREEDE